MRFCSLPDTAHHHDERNVPGAANSAGGFAGRDPWCGRTDHRYWLLGIKYHQEDRRQAYGDCPIARRRDPQVLGR